MGAALRAGQLLPRRHRQGGRHIVPVGAAVAGQAGVHQPQAVEQLRPRAGRCCGFPARRAAGGGPGPPGHTAPRPRPPWPPGSSGGGCRWTGPLNTAGSPRHTGRPAPERIFRSRTPRRCRRFGSAELLRQYFSNCGLWAPRTWILSGLCACHIILSILLAPIPRDNGLSSHPVKS